MMYQCWTHKQALMNYNRVKMYLIQFDLTSVYIYILTLF